MAQSKAPNSNSRSSDKPKQPKFGAWDDKEVPYTAYFDNAGKTKQNPVEPQKGDEPVPRQDNASVRNSLESHQRRASADSHAKPHAVKSSSVEQSPIHARAGGKGSAGSQPSSSDSWQGVSAKPRHKTASRAAPTHKGGGPAVPEFGAWNKNPEQAEGYTGVFRQVLTEKNTPGHVNAVTSTPRRISKNQNEGNCFSRLFKCFSSSG